MFQNGDEKGGLKLASGPDIWKTKYPVKVMIFLWLIHKKAILIWSKLQSRGWSWPSICVLCKAMDESTEHILLTSRFANCMLIKCASFFIQSTDMWLWMISGANVGLVGILFSLNLIMIVVIHCTYREKEIVEKREYNILIYMSFYGSLLAFYCS